MEGAATSFSGPAGCGGTGTSGGRWWNVTIDVYETRDLGDIVLAMARVRTTRRGERDRDSSGRSAYVFQFDDGLVRKARAYLDPQEALEAVGLSE